MTTEQGEPKRGYLRYMDVLTGSLEQKRSYRQYKARVAALPANYRTALEALFRYLTYSGGITKGDVLVQMLNDLADLFEQSAADGTPIRSIVGDDPVEFVETFLQNYSDGQWINKERRRLIEAIDRAAADNTREGGAL
jgi:DNA-binding ferritin-like protein (Dps family)